METEVLELCLPIGCRSCDPKDRHCGQKERIPPSAAGRGVSLLVWEEKLPPSRVRLGDEDGMCLSDGAERGGGRRVRTSLSFQ